MIDITLIPKDNEVYLKHLRGLGAWTLIGNAKKL